MVRVKKCQSKKHDGGGCGNPKCPEGESIQAAKDAAVENNDSNSFITAREKEESKLSLSSMKAWVKGAFAHSAQEAPVTEVTSKLPDTDMLERIQSIRDIDKTHLPSFTELGELNKYLNNLYRPHAEVTIYPVFDNSEAGLKALSVDDMHVDEGLRGLGVGRHMRATILKFSDENNYAVVGIPTIAGDGTVAFEDPNFKDHAIEHRKRLEDFYLDSGYEYNYAFDPASHDLFDPLYAKKDELTGEPYPSDPEWETKFRPEALTMLKESGFYVRWPNNQIPKEWKRLDI